MPLPRCRSGFQQRRCLQWLSISPGRHPGTAVMTDSRAAGCVFLWMVLWIVRIFITPKHDYPMNWWAWTIERNQWDLLMLLHDWTKTCFKNSNMLVLISWYQLQPKSCRTRGPPSIIVRPLDPNTKLIRESSEHTKQHLTTPGKKLTTRTSQLWRKGTQSYSETPC